MTEQTIELIKTFAKDKDLRHVPSIIIGMQEEDGVSAAINYRNSFRLLRNFAAHEPNVLVSQIVSGDNKGNAKIAFIGRSEDVEDRVIVWMVEFAVWMFDMYLITNNMAYLVFWKTLMSVLYPMNVKPSGKQFKFYPVGEENLLAVFLRWQEYMVETRHLQKAISKNDPYIIRVYKTDVKTFWRIAIPDMMLLCNVYASGDIDLKDKANIEWFLKLFQERTGVNGKEERIGS